jgi:hypothetical protein
LYEASGNLSDALVAYRLAFDAFREAQTLYGTPVPDTLPRDLLRTTDALGLTDEHHQYRGLFPHVSWVPLGQTRDLAELIFVAYEGRAPIKYDVLLDVPFSRDALAVVLATRGFGRPPFGGGHPADSVLYGLTGHIIRLAVPRFAPRRSRVSRAEAVVIGNDTVQRAPLALIEDITAIAMKDLDERIVRTTVKAVARAAWKYAMAEGVELGVRGAFGKDREGAYLAGAIAGALARMFAIASEQADKRSWVTLPDRIELGRLLVPPGTYDVEFHYSGRGGEALPTQVVRGITIHAGEKRFITTRVMQ